ncbi:MAG TPA: DNA internalization-related competence protein ComEC/Rec2 [Candidatus Limiplasma sp.]|nr:DNA internalization-related competence protein ComEC/Rec2 [Candidatus Limiplasma sp.]HRX09746.1 DNA internalization-related competence protein ComEC/Rec2 [Candidatus Limiplasma sp.]
MKKHIASHNERNLFLPALAGFFVAGIWLATNVTAGLWPLWLLAVAVLAILPLRWLRLKIRLCLLPVALMLSLLWTMHWLNPPMPAEGKYETITATVYGDSKISSSGNVSFRVANITLDGETQPGMAYATIYVDGDEPPVQLLDGQQIRFSGKVYHPYPKENRYDFDFSLWMLENGLRFGITSVQDVELLSGDTHWADYAGHIAAACYEKLQPVMGARADLAVAMLLGESNVLAEDDYAAFQRAGVAHIMAVSGLHVGILSMALLWLLTRLRMRKTWQIPVVAVFLLVYCGVTGFAVSSMRAAVMVLLWVIASAFGRKPNPVTVISTAMLIVLIINPLQLFSAGFVLSFSAIAGIALLYPRFMQGLERLWPYVRVKRQLVFKYHVQRILHRFKQALAVTLSAQLGVLLPIAAYYHLFYPYSLAFNLAVVPVVGILVPLYAVTTLVIWIPWLGSALGVILGAVATGLSDAVLWLVRLSAALPFAEIRMATPDAWICVAALCCAVTISQFIRASVRRRLIAVAAVAVIAVTGSILTAPPPLRYHQLSVGWADSALIVDHGTAIGIDTGNTGSEMLNRLLAEGRDLDALILTHLHSDHAGGLEAILDHNIRIGHVYIPVDYTLHGYASEILGVLQRLRDEGIPVTELKAGDSLAFPETTIDVLWPQEGRTREGIDPNDRSMAMLITLGGVRILSVGDNGTLYEQYLAVPADVLKVGHHGSRTGTQEAFLQTVVPSLAVISVRSDSLPAPSTLERLSLYGVSVLSTEDAGEITIVPANGSYRAYRYIPEETH